MSRFFYVSLLFVMSLVGFGAVQSATAASAAVPGSQDGVNVGKNSLNMGDHCHWWDRQPDPRPRSPAVAGIRG